METLGCPEIGGDQGLLSEIVQGDVHLQSFGLIAATVVHCLGGTASRQWRRCLPSGLDRIVIPRLTEGLSMSIVSD